MLCAKKEARCDFDGTIGVREAFLAIWICSCTKGVEQAGSTGRRCRRKTSLRRSRSQLVRHC